MRTFIILIIFIVSSSAFSNGIDDYRVIAYENVILFERPAPDSKSIKKMRIPQVVKVLKQNELSKINNTHGRWLFVDTERFIIDPKDTIKGWLFDYYLASKTDFKKLHMLKSNMRLATSYGDSGCEYYFNKNGSYKLLTNYGVSKGHLFIGKNVIMPVVERHKKIPHFKTELLLYINKDGIICREGGNDDDSDVCAKCE